MTCLCLIFFLDRESPCHVKLLRTQKVVYISCGEEHTAVLTKVRLGGRGCGGGEMGSLTCRRVAVVADCGTSIRPFSFALFRLSWRNRKKTAF